MCSPVVADKDDNHAIQLQLADEYQKALEENAHLRQAQVDKDTTIAKLRQQVEHLRGDSLSRHKKEPPAANMLQRVNAELSSKAVLGEGNRAGTGFGYLDNNPEVLQFSSHETSILPSSAQTQMQSTWTAYINSVDGWTATKLKRWTKHGDGGDIAPQYSSSAEYDYSWGSCTFKKGYVGSYSGTCCNSGTYMTLMVYVKAACAGTGTVSLTESKSYVTRKVLRNAWKINCGTTCGGCYAYNKPYECGQVADMTWHNIAVGDLDPDKFGIH